MKQNFRLKSPDDQFPNSVGIIGKAIQDTNENKTQLIYDIIKTEYGTVPKNLSKLFKNTTELYEGKWPEYEPCQVRYHNLSHALDVALLTARMTAGWNKQGKRYKIPKDIFLNGLAAAVFHDSGYLKSKGDQEGKGGKYTFTHEKRSMELAGKYLAQSGWQKKSVTDVKNIISITQYHNQPVIENLFSNEHKEVMAKIVGTSDLVAQMADVDYVQRIHDLFDEMQEAYGIEGTENLANRGIHIFHSAQEMIDETMGFYENFVLPMLHKFGRMDQYLVSYFANGRNPYLENIAANLSGQLMDKRVQWRRLGEILQEIGVVTPQQITNALERQKKLTLLAQHKKKNLTPLKDRVISWISNRNYTGKCLGDILMETSAISATILRKGLFEQILPPALLEKLSRHELLFILKIAILLQNLTKGPWVFDQILEMTNELLSCEASSILLADVDAREMIVVVPTGPKKDSLHSKTIQIDKGIAGWVYRHVQPVIVKNVAADERFDDEIDRRIGFKTRSILAVPLHTNGELIGVMEIVNKKNDNFTVQDMDILTMLANVIALALGGLLNLQEFYT